MSVVSSLLLIKLPFLFAEALVSEDPLLQEFGMGGLSNICLEPRHRDYIMSKDIYRENIIKCLDNSKSINLVVNAMSTLMQLVTAENYIGKKKFECNTFY